MSRIQKYWTFIRLDGTGRTKTQIVVAARNLIEQRLPDLLQEESERELRQQLIQIWQDRTAPLGDRYIAEQCLRCFISHQILAACIELAERFGKNGRFNARDLLPLVLNDVEIHQPLIDLTVAQADQSSNEANKPGEQGIDESPDASHPSLVPSSRKSSYRILSVEILRKFNAERGQLSAWTRRMVERDAQIDAFLLECGIYRRNDWALLSNTTARKLRKSLSNQLSPPELEQAIHLLKAYQTIYQADRLIQNQTGQKYTAPTVDQLQRIAEALLQDGCSWSIKQVEKKLQILAKQLRQTLVQATDPLDEQRADQLPAPTSDPAMEDGLLRDYFHEFLECLDRAIDQVLDHRLAQHRKRKLPNDQQFLTALCLFYCQLRSMIQIAKDLSSPAQTYVQYQITRLLKLKELREDIRRYMIENIRHHPHLNQQIDTDINWSRIHKLDQELDKVLDKIIAEDQAETSSPSRSGKSLLSDRICRRLRARQVCC